MIPETSQLFGIISPVFIDFYIEFQKIFFEKSFQIFSGFFSYSFQGFALCPIRIPFWVSRSTIITERILIKVSLSKTPPYPLLPNKDFFFIMNQNFFLNGFIDKKTFGFVRKLVFCTLWPSGRSSRIRLKMVSTLNFSNAEMGRISALGNCSSQKLICSFTFSWSDKSILLSNSKTGILVFLIFSKTFHSSEFFRRFPP